MLLCRFCIELMSAHIVFQVYVFGRRNGLQHVDNVCLTINKYSDEKR